MVSNRMMLKANDKRKDPVYGRKIGFIPFAFHLVPIEGLAKVAAVMRSGERSGRGDNWKDVPVAEHLNHAICHIYGYLCGDRTENHLANAGCRVLMAIALDTQERLPEPRIDPKPFVEDGSS